MRRAGVVFAVLGLLGGTSGDAAAEKPYAIAGVLEIGGLAQVGYDSTTTEAAGIEQDTSTLSGDGEIVGNFVDPRFQILGGALLRWADESTDDEDDITTS